MNVDGGMRYALNGTFEPLLQNVHSERHERQRRRKQSRDAGLPAPGFGWIPPRCSSACAFLQAPPYQRVNDLPIEPRGLAQVGLRDLFPRVEATRHRRRHAASPTNDTGCGGARLLLALLLGGLVGLRRIRLVIADDALDRADVEYRTTAAADGERDRAKNHGDLLRRKDRYCTPVARA
jgi:hypothetical protein